VNNGHRSIIEFPGIWPCPFACPGRGCHSGIQLQVGDRIGAPAVAESTRQLRNCLRPVPLSPSFRCARRVRRAKTV
jgi:hypothetical protein